MLDASQKSGILEWSDENIKNSPITPGVYVLTNSPTNGTAVALKCVDNLRGSLEDLFRTGDLDPSFFYWYSTQNIEEAKDLYERLRSFYNMGRSHPQ